MDVSIVVSLLETLIAVVVAIALPLWIESRRRPRFQVRVGEPTVGHGGGFKFLHVRVINEPLKSRWLLRNTATGCQASLSFEELGSGRRPVQLVPARWAATPEPLSLFPSTGGIGAIFDITRVPQSYRLDLSPGEAGEAVTVAVKHGAHESAFAFNADSYEAEAGAARYCVASSSCRGTSTA